MIGTSILISLALVLGIASLGATTDLVLMWEWPHKLGLPTWNLTQAAITGASVDQTQHTLTTLAHAECQQRSPEYVPGETWCAVQPCPGVGAYTLLLQADESDPSNALLFGITDASSCKVVSYDEALKVVAGGVKPTVPAVPVPSPVTPPPDTATPPVVVPPAQPVPPPVATPTPEPSPPKPVPPHPQPKPDPPPLAPTAPPTPPPAASGTNLVAGPTAAQPWRGGSFAGTQADVRLDPTVQRNGHPVQQLTGQGGYYATTTSRAFAVEAGQTYDVSAWVKLEHMTEFVEVDVFYWSTHGQQLARWGEAVGGRLTGTHDWTPLHGEVTIPPGADRAVLQVRAKSHGGRAWVDDVQMVAKDHTPVVVAAPPREPEVTPASPLVPPTPSPLAAVPTAAPAQRRQALQEQFDRLKQDYEAAQRTIRETYEATLKALEKDTTPSGQQQRQQAYETGTQALDTVYKTLLEAWTGLAAQWERVP